MGVNEVTFDRIASSHLQDSGSSKTVFVPDHCPDAMRLDFALWIVFFFLAWISHPF